MMWARGLPLKLNTIFAGPHFTIADRLQETRGRPTGFDYLRVVLAIAIVLWHTVATSYGAMAQRPLFAGPYRAVFTIILPLFFALSGFLVAGSLERTPALTKFLGLRVLRIVPALAVEALISAFILGPVLTSLPVRKYFADPQFSHYLLNIVGIIHYRLPGVFLHNPNGGIVNGQLWTVPFEFQCYFLLALLAFLGVAGSRRLIFLCVAGLQIALLASRIWLYHGHFHIEASAVHGHVLVMTFLAGVTLFSLRDFIIYNRTLFFVSAALTVVCLSVPLGDYFVEYPAAYATVYLGLQNPRANSLHKLGDLSYGIFLYGFPMQQLVASWGVWTHHWYINFVLALPLTIIIAWLSWNLVEKHALKLKRHLGFLRPLDLGLEAIKGSVRSGHDRVRIAYGRHRRSTPEGFVP